ncbi:MAG: hypothetical protein ACRC0G_08200, partial [Fusobacteriaceae bacterium]
LNEEVIIRREDVKKSILRDAEAPIEEPIFMGVDVSSGDSNDHSVICVRQGMKELERVKVKIRLSELRDLIIEKVKSYRCVANSIVVNIDTTGIGYQLGQDLEDVFYDMSTVDINKINFSYKAVINKVFGNVVTEMFFMFKENINEISLLSLPESSLEEDLGSRRYTYDSTNRYIAEKKKDFIKRFKRSPDEGDAVLLAFYNTADMNKLEEIYLDRSDW